VRNVPLVGQCSALMMEAIIRHKKIPLDSMHVIGFSLGAQVAGELGKRMTSGQFERITGDYSIFFIILSKVTTV
jgi:surfactin synthase thioesterase subunit